jgi:hypothetical protein
MSPDTMFIVLDRMHSYFFFFVGAWDKKKKRLKKMRGATSISRNRQNQIGDL